LRRFPRSINRGIVLNRGANGIVLPESALLTTKKVLAERIEPFQLLQAKSVITHLRIREDLGGCGLTPPAESALLAIEKTLAEANQLSQLLELKKVFPQGFLLGQAAFFLGQALLGQAGAGGIGLGVTLLYWTALLLAKKAANASQLFQPLQAMDPQVPAQQGEPLKQKVATLGFEELALNLGKLLLDFEVETPGLVQLAQKGEGIKSEIG
jgi:hypothetical protein